jgi:hypothetical protein
MFYMSLKFRKTSYMSINLLMTTSLSFTLIFSGLRTCTPINYCSKARVDLDSIHGLPFIILHLNLLLSLVRLFPWTNGTSGLVIMPIPWSPESLNPINCPCLHLKFPPFYLHVSRARVTVFILVVLHLFPAILCNCCFFMYMAILL